jgi:hypothetical protein
MNDFWNFICVPLFRQDRRAALLHATLVCRNRCFRFAFNLLPLGNVEPREACPILRALEMFGVRLLLQKAIDVVTFTIPQLDVSAIAVVER